MTRKAELQLEALRERSGALALVVLSLDKQIDANPANDSLYELLGDAAAMLCRNERLIAVAMRRAAAQLCQRKMPAEIERPREIRPREMRGAA